MDIESGYIGLFIASFLAATIVPFSSEIILSGMLIAGYSPLTCLFVATTGNWLGGISSYAIGYLGKWIWIEKYLRIPIEKIESTTKSIDGKELWISLFCWLPGVGDVIALVLGLLKANTWTTITGMLIGKLLRYAIWGYITLKALEIL